jgi:hypothetical protein
VLTLGGSVGVSKCNVDSALGLILDVLSYVMIFHGMACSVAFSYRVSYRIYLMLYYLLLSSIIFYYLILSYRIVSYIIL